MDTAEGGGRGWHARRGRAERQRVRETASDRRLLHRPPFGANPAAHDRFVLDYFAGLGLPRDQVLNMRGMTMLDASGRSADIARPRLRVSAYYSVVQRAVGGVAVPDSSPGLA